MTLGSRIKKLEERTGGDRQPLVICLGDPWRDDEAPDGEVCHTLEGRQEVPPGAQVIIYRQRPDGPQ